MIAEVLSPEVVNQLAHLAPLALPVLMALNQAQKNWVDRRDGGKCQAPFEHECNGAARNKRHKHHILPQRYAKRFGINPDYPENVVSLCENAHVGNGHETGPVIHPDMLQARQEYRSGNKNAYKEITELRSDLLDNKQVYWNTDFDRAMQALAVLNTQQFDEPWPEKKQWQKKTTPPH